MTPRLPTCSSCEGFVPMRARACPHCGASRTLARTVAALVGGVAVMTLSACYGPALEHRALPESKHPATTADGTKIDAAAKPDVPKP